VLELSGICKVFPGVVALDEVSFTIARGEVHAIVGENGAGKSTLMKILSGVYTADRGALTLDSEPLHLKSTRDARDRGIAIIHQELNLIPELSIAENIYLGREPRTPWGTLDRRRMIAWSRQLLLRLDLTVDPRRAISSLRIGEQQLVEVAKALSFDARLLILDEPTSALSANEIGRLFAVIRSLKQHGVTMVYISHKFEEIFALADTVTVLRDGRHVATMEATKTDEAELVRLMVGRELTDLFPKQVTTIGAPVLRVQHLAWHPPAARLRRSLHDISFDLRAGEILGVAGLMGSGRTELLETIFGVHPRREVRGVATIDDRPTRPRTPRQALRRRIAFVTEDRKSQSLVVMLSVATNTTLAALRTFCRGGFVRHGQERAAVNDLIHRLRIRTPNPGVRVEVLSGGNQQKVAIAKCLLTGPRVLLLDEPTRGIDVGAKAEIYGLMSHLAASGTAILMASSELPELLAMCDRVLVMREGRLVSVLEGEQMTQVDIMAAATRQVA
jgi:ABC-type sugar transport system ATPase subunit